MRQIKDHTPPAAPARLPLQITAQAEGRRAGGDIGAAQPVALHGGCSPSVTPTAPGTKLEHPRIPAGLWVAKPGWEASWGSLGPPSPAPRAGDGVPAPREAATGQGAPGARRRPRAAFTRAWRHRRGRGKDRERTYRKDFMSKPRLRICPTTWSQLPGLERLRPPAVRCLEPAAMPWRPWPPREPRGLPAAEEPLWAWRWPRLWLVVGWLWLPRWCWLRGCCRLCWRMSVRGLWHLGSPAEVGIYSRVVAVDKVESSKLRERKGRGEERKEKKVKGQNWRKEKKRVREKMPQRRERSGRGQRLQRAVPLPPGRGTASPAAPGSRAAAISPAAPLLPPGCRRRGAGCPPAAAAPSQPAGRPTSSAS